MVREDRIKEILEEIPEDVVVVAAAKGKCARDVVKAAGAGIKVIGENYIQQARDKITLTRGLDVEWHFIGHLQRNKVRKAVELFDMIQTLDSLSLAGALDKECSRQDRFMPVLIEVNIGREPRKAGVFPEEVPDFLEKISGLSRLRIRGLMTMGPFCRDPEKLRPFFRETRKLFDFIAGIYKNNDHIDWKYLSMGMSDSYKIALEEGANMVRLGTVIFGAREEKGYEYKNSV